ncbi:MAG: phosphatidylserine decarboxylase, partial [Pseudomonadota bacterium]
MDFLPSIHKEGYIFILIFLAVTILFSVFSDKLAIIGIILTLWCIYFFRNPERIVPIGDNLIISPADGVVQKIEAVEPPVNLDMGKNLRVRVSIFLNVFNVHVNRIPATGTIKKLYYHPGKFFNASLDKASIYNERQEASMIMKGGEEIAFSQIAGLIARRIVCDLEEKQKVESGERFGIIRFGSRMDV